VEGLHVYRGGSEVKVGSILDGRFEITSILGHGALTTIYDARDLQSRRQVALKVPSPGCLRDPLYRTRFEREESTGKALEHPAILRVVATERKSRPYIVMERVEGTPLSGLLREGIPLPVPEALEIGIQVARTLEYLHGRKVVHRDLKPANILLCVDRSIRLIDFGLAKVGEGPEPGPAVSQAFGTPDYMPPEQVCGMDGDPRSDIYSLGAMLYEMLTGVPPFQDEDPIVVMEARVVGDPTAPSLLNRALSPQLEEILLHALERKPERRFASAEEFRKALEHPEAVPLTGRASRLVPPAAWKILWRRVQDFVWAMLAILCFFAVMILVAWKWGRFLGRS
jgi:serine/threonine protein kinase